MYNSEDYYFDLIELNETASSVVQALYKAKSVGNAKTKAVARYYVDMQMASKNCYRMLSEKGIAIFIIGDTEYKGVKIENNGLVSDGAVNNDALSSIMLSILFIGIVSAVIIHDARAVRRQHSDEES